MIGALSVRIENRKRKVFKTLEHLPFLLQVPQYNLRHRRSKSNGDDLVLDHRPTGLLNLGKYSDTSSKGTGIYTKLS